MPVLRPLAIVANYSELHSAFRSYVQEIDVSRLTIDAVSGMQEGYCAKLLAPDPMRHFGKKSLGEFMGAVALKLVVVQDVGAFEQLRHRLPERLRPGHRRLMRLA
jgi:hypothetical protein